MEATLDIYDRLTRKSLEVERLERENAQLRAELSERTQAVELAQSRLDEQEAVMAEKTARVAHWVSEWLNGLERRKTLQNELADLKYAAPKPRPRWWKRGK